MHAADLSRTGLRDLPVGLPRGGVTGLRSDARRSGARAVDYPLRYAETTEAGSLPRSLTVNPFWRAHVRTSALLGGADEGGRLGAIRFDDAEWVLADAAGPD